MSQRWNYLIFYTASTRKPVIRKLYRDLLKNCISFKQVDLPTGTWLFTETKLNFRRGKNWNEIDKIIEFYEKSLAYKNLLEKGLKGDEKSVNKLLREGYGQDGIKKIDFLAAYCWQNRKDFNEISRYYTHNVPIPEEYLSYINEKIVTKGTEERYLDLFEPNYDFEDMNRLSTEYENQITWYKKVFYRRHQLDAVEKARKERAEKKERLKNQQLEYELSDLEDSSDGEEI